ncbi:hypothetical protein BX257_3657 [Streptomyces sp. 3212.3]|nr:hypothetical protein BX257_3657 [Streptomyces sp. 3212.3]
MSLAATIEGGQGSGVPRRAGHAATVAMVTGPDYWPDGAAVLAASRTAPATAPATFSLKTLGTM